MSTRHYNAHWPHQGLLQRPPVNLVGKVIDIAARIERRSVVGGLISEYHRATWQREAAGQRL